MALGCLAGSCGKDAEQEHGPDAQMDHDIGGVEYVVPVRDMLDINEIDNAAVEQAIEYVAGSATNNETEAYVFIALQVPTQPQVRNHTAQNGDTHQSEQPP